ncbi:MAG: hypothetical protein ACRDN9_15755 [Streptosporangiaceae bacterium]
MDTEGAVDLLDEVRRVRSRSQERRPGMWFPMLLFGALSLVSVAVIVGYGAEWLGAYWPIAGIGGSLATAVFYQRGGRRVGFESRGRPYVAAAAVILCGAFVTGSVGGALDALMVATVGPFLAVSAGLLMFARVDRNPPLTAFALAGAVFCIGLAMAGVGPDPAALALAVGYGVCSVVLGAGDWMREHRWP